MTLIEKSNLHTDSLSGQVAVVSGAGRGIGIEAARALLALGARVVIAEIDEQLASKAEMDLGGAFGKDRVMAVPTDVGDEAAVARLADRVVERFGQVDIVINNATVTPMGAVWDVAIDRWDHSYSVNLRGPVLLARQFIPGMLAKGYGVFVCVSSVGEAFMGAYETLKAAQVHLAATLDAELEGTGVYAFAIGPGLVRTPGADAGIESLAPLYGKSVEEFYEMSREHIVSAEEAGTGFAAAVALAPRFRGQEISSRHALNAAGISANQVGAGLPLRPNEGDPAAALALCHSVTNTLKEQSSGWSKRSLFERQWMFRDFKKNAGMPVEDWLKTLSGLEMALAREDWDAVHKQNVPVAALARYYVHLMELARGYEKDPTKLDVQMRMMQEWIDDANALAALLN
jgi:NAD(P)-dependent dehydrogenase (short-subunit alcohol dehydrogenase family)